MKSSRKLTSLFIISVLFTSILFAKALLPPVAAKKAKASTLHGENRTDNYYWIRDKTNPEVMNYLKAENAYADQMLSHTKPFQEKLYNEMLSRIKETDLSVPYRYGNYFYYSRTEKGKQYP